MNRISRIVERMASDVKYEIGGFGDTGMTIHGDPVLFRKSEREVLERIVKFDEQELSGKISKVLDRYGFEMVSVYSAIGQRKMGINNGDWVVTMIFKWKQKKNYQLDELKRDIEAELK